MATVKDTLWKCLLNFPTVFTNALSVYDHWFCVNGNGYEWENGELVCPEYGDSDLEKLHNAKTINEAIINHLEYHLIKNWDKGGISKNFLHCYIDSEDEIAKYVKKENERVIIYIKMIMDSENRMKDFSIPVDPLLGDKNKFEFYPLCKYAKLYTFPDDVTSDWLRALKQMVDLIEEHKELIDDHYNLFPGIKERVYKLYNDRSNKVRRHPTKSDDIEYIRKDVLCHWIHGQIRTLRTSEASGLCMGQDVAIYTLEKVIEKINSP